MAQSENPKITVFLSVNAQCSIQELICRVLIQKLLKKKKKQQWQNEDQKTHTLGRAGGREPGLCGFRK